MKSGSQWMKNQDKQKEVIDFGQRRTPYGEWIEIDAPYVSCRRLKCKFSIMKKGVGIMQVKELMTRDIEFVNSNDSIKQAAEKMKELNVGVLPVKTGNKLVGMLTDRDIVVRSVAPGLDPEKHQIIDAFSEGVVACNGDDDIKDVARLMEERQIRRVVVKDNEEKVIGIVSLGDLAVNIGKEMVGEVLKEVSEPSEPAR
jgi:CBS domain-containing protein